jgi:hypothetical protein
MHLRRAIFAENGLTPVVMDEKMQQDVFNVYNHCIETYERTKGMIPAGNLCEVRFEDLEVDPMGEMHRVYQTLNLGGWENLQVAIQKQLPQLTRYKKNSFKMDEDLMRKVYSRWKASFERYGYPSTLEDEKAEGRR